MTSPSVTIQISPESALPCWFAEVTAFAQVLSHTGITSALIERVRFARARFGQYDLIDFIVVLIGYGQTARTYTASVLRTAGAVCRAVHGTLWAPSLASPIDPVPLSGCS